MRMLFTLQGLPLRAAAMQLGGFVEERLRCQGHRPPTHLESEEGSPLWSVSLWSLLRGVSPGARRPVSIKGAFPQWEWRLEVAEALLRDHFAWLLKALGQTLPGPSQDSPRPGSGWVGVGVGGLSCPSEALDGGLQ